MADVLAVDREALNTLRSDLATTADTVATLNGTSVGLEQGAAGLPGTATAAACATAGPVLMEGLTLVSQRVQVTSDAVGQAIATYTEAADEFARAVRTIGI